MITTIFKNSSPINYTFVGVLMFLFFFISQFSLDFSVFSVNQIFIKVIILVLLTQIIEKMKFHSWQATGPTLDTAGGFSTA